MIFLDETFSIPNFPSRILDYLDMALPVFACTDVNSDIKQEICDEVIDEYDRIDLLRKKIPKGLYEQFIEETAVLNEAGAATPVIFESDSDAQYDDVIEIDLSKLESTVSFPHLPSNTKTFSNMPKVKIDQVVIGSCTNGRISDLRAAAEILKGRHVDKSVRAIIIPATQKIYRQAMHEGLFDIFLDAGCVISTPTCGPCLGGYMGILAAGERAISTTNRNFVGRMGHVESEVYLASPHVAAASAVTGYITDPNTH